MKQILVTMLALGMFLLTGCDKEEPAPPPAPEGGDVQPVPAEPKPVEPKPAEPKPAEPVGGDDAPDVSKVIDAAKSEATKEVYVGTTEKMMAGWGAKLDGLIAATKEKGGELSDSSKKALDDLEKKKEDVKAKLAELKDKSGEAWTEAKPHLDEAMADLEKAYNSAVAEFQEKPEPPAEPKVVPTPPTDG
jgi:hypothetical protein